MRFFLKLFTAIVLVLTLTLAAVQYYTIAVSLDAAVERETGHSLSQFQLMRYTLRVNVGENADADNLTLSALTAAAEKASQLLADGEFMSVTAGAESLYDDLPAGLPPVAPRPEVRQGIRTVGEQYYLWVAGAFRQDEQALALVLVRDVSEVFAMADAMQQQCQRVCVIIALGGCLLLLALTWALTRPIEKLKAASTELMRGHYDVRAEVKGHDELAELGHAFNAMADALQSKILALEDAVRSREDFVANFAHELKTPLTSIIGYADTLYQKELPPEQARAAAEYIVNEGLRLEALSLKLLELSVLNRERWVLEEVYAPDLLRDVADTFMPAAQKRGIHFSCHAADAWVRVEFDLFKTMLLNLLDNAGKSGGSRVELAGENRDGGYEITITDDGRGISAQELPRITEPFYMVDKSRGRAEHGAGLGLALSSEIAGIHRTALRFDSAEGIGTTVRLRLEVNRCEEP